MKLLYQTHSPYARKALALRWETVRRPEALRYAPLQQGYTAKLISSYDWLESELHVEAPLDVGHIALATVFGLAGVSGAAGLSPGSAPAHGLVRRVRRARIDARDAAVR